MAKLVDKGYTTFDLADHYGPAEDFVGAFETEQRAEAARGQVRTRPGQLSILGSGSGGQG